MGPLGLILNIAAGHVDNPQPTQWATLFLPSFVMAACAVVVARFVRRIVRRQLVRQRHLQGIARAHVDRIAEELVVIRAQADLVGFAGEAAKGVSLANRV